MEQCQRFRPPSPASGCALMQDEEHHDVVVLGGGPAGVSCALECFDIQLDTVLLETHRILGGQLVEIQHRVRNVAAGEFENGRALQHALEWSAAILADRVRLEQRAARADLGDPSVEVDGRRITAKAMLIATGSAKQRLPAAPDGAFSGDVTYEIESGMDRFLGRDVVIIGGGDSATLDALALAREGSSVMLVHRSDRLTARRDIVEDVRRESRITDLPGWELDAVQGTDRLEEIVLVRPVTGERRTVTAGGLIIKISRLPNTSAFRGQLELDRHGAVVVDDELRTSRPGVFAAGDVVAGAYWRVATALGQGCLAARSILRYVEERP
jgi:thioredoxin reductase (NADPH)